MPVWSEILREIRETRVGDGALGPDFDMVRRKYLYGLHQRTGRNVVLYASAWIQKDLPGNLFSISDEDIQALMEVTNGLHGSDLDLILHSPGGSPEAAEGIVTYLRSRFSHIRVIVPHLAMSAATMIACAGDEVVMGKHSFLGPTDPQLSLLTTLGPRQVPAQAILDQFEMAKRECADPANLPVWLPMLSPYSPDLLVICKTALNLSKELVKTWLEAYMFKGVADGESKAVKISERLADHTYFKSHSRHISRNDLRNLQLVVIDLEADQIMQDLALSVFHATTQTFDGTPTVKIVENHTGRAFVKQQVTPSSPALQFGVGPIL